MTQQLPYRCVNCNSQWPEGRDTCVFCGSTERRRNAEPVLNTPRPPSLQPLPRDKTANDYVTPLTWDQAFDIVFKIIIAFAVWSVFLGGISGAIIWYLFWRSA